MSAEPVELNLNGIHDDSNYLNVSKGATGVTGVSGVTSVTSMTNENGATGVTGVTNENGPTGVTHENGPTGATGVTNENGGTGVTHENGGTGVTHENGATGVTGVTNENGATGVTNGNGATGVTNKNGPTGITAEEAGECHEKTIILPDNTGTTCWWLSMNFALFHRKRPELEGFFKKNPDTIFNPLYTYYNGSAKLDDITKVSEEIRTKVVELKGFSVTDKFDITSSKFQDVSEYALPLLDTFTIPLHSLGNDDVVLGKLYDIRIALESKGVTVETDEVVDSTGEKKYTKIQKFSDTTKTLVVYYDRSKYKEGKGEQEQQTLTKLHILREMTIPVGSCTDCVFELDAVIVRPDYAHFVTYVKCSSSEEWVLYGAMSGSGNRKTFSSFDAMLKERESIETGAVLLFYTRKESSSAVQQGGNIVKELLGLV